MLRLHWSWHDLMECPPDILAELIDLLVEADAEQGDADAFGHLHEQLRSASLPTSLR